MNYFIFGSWGTRKAVTLAAFPTQDLWMKGHDGFFLYRLSEIGEKYANYPARWGSLIKGNNLKIKPCFKQKTLSIAPGGNISVSKQFLCPILMDKRA